MTTEFCCKSQNYNDFLIEDEGEEDEKSKDDLIESNVDQIDEDEILTKKDPDGHVVSMRKTKLRMSPRANSSTKKSISP